MGNMGTLFKFTTMAMLALAIPLSTPGMAISVVEVGHQQTSKGSKAVNSELSAFLNCANYEPDPNGNPKSDGTGTR